ncbi:DMT family transporter [Ectobacillus funiculus]|uniref:DMT family transporter n=1 Tax=Ectobacillus funiculus TaxID=137993 RepID=UPI0039795C35
MKVLFYFIALVAGASLSIEGAIGGTLGRNIGEIETTFYMFTIGFMTILLITLFLGKGDLSQMFKVPKWKLIGGSLGSFYNLMLVISVPIIGVGISVIAALFGQIAMSALIEHYGWLESSKIKFNKNKGIAIVLLAASLYLVY